MQARTRTNLQGASAVTLAEAQEKQTPQSKRTNQIADQTTRHDNAAKAKSLEREFPLRRTRSRQKLSLSFPHTADQPLFHSPPGAQAARGKCSFFVDLVQWGVESTTAHHMSTQHRAHQTSRLHVSGQCDDKSWVTRSWGMRAHVQRRKAAGRALHAARSILCTPCVVFKCSRGCPHDLRASTLYLLLESSRRERSLISCAGACGDHTAWTERKTPSPDARQGTLAPAHRHSKVPTSHSNQTLPQPALAQIPPPPHPDCTHLFQHCCGDWWLVWSIDGGWVVAKHTLIKSTAHYLDRQLPPPARRLRSTDLDGCTDIKIWCGGKGRAEAFWIRATPTTKHKPHITPQPRSQCRSEPRSQITRPCCQGSRHSAAPPAPHPGSRSPLAVR